MVGPGDVVTYNCLRNNGQYGFKAFAAAGNHKITFDHNEVTGNNTANWEQRVPGCGCTAGKFWNVIGAVVTNNWIHNNHGPARALRRHRQCWLRYRAQLYRRQ